MRWERPCSDPNDSYDATRGGFRCDARFRCSKVDQDATLAHSEENSRVHVGGTWDEEDWVATSWSGLLSGLSLVHR